MTYQHLHFDIDGRLATVRLARPEARNALSLDVRRALAAFPVMPIVLVAAFAA